MSKQLSKNPIDILRYSINNIFANPVILFPFTIVIFIQLFALEILYFAHRFPLSKFFGPLIKFQNEAYMHYPYNFIFMTQWFQKVQMPIYVLFSCYFIGVAVLIIEAINSEKKVNMKLLFKKAFDQYVHLLFSAVILVSLMLLMSYLYGFLVQRALVIRSESGVYYIIKRIVLDGAPLANLMFAVIITTVFAFVIPMIVIEKKKIFAALAENFRILPKHIGCLFLIAFIPNLLYVPVLLIKVNNRIIENFAIPDLWAGLIIFTVLIMFCIDVIIYTAITTYYLLQRESK